MTCIKIMILLIGIVISSEFIALNPSAPAFTPQSHIRKGMVYHLNRKDDVGYIRYGADDYYLDYWFRPSQAFGKILSNGCEVMFQILNEQHPKAIYVTRVQEYTRKEIIQAVRFNNFLKLDTMLKDLGETIPNQGIQYLLTRDQDIQGNTVLHYANDIRTYKILFAFFLKHDVQNLINFVLQENFQGENILFTAIELQNEAMISILYHIIAQVHSRKKIIEFTCKKNIFGTPPFHEAFMFNNEKLIKFFINVLAHYSKQGELIPEFMIKNQFGDTILHLAAHNVEIQIIPFIVKEFLLVNQKFNLMKLLAEQDFRGNTVLHILANNEQYQMLSFVLDLCERISSKKQFIKLLLISNESDETILHCLCKRTPVMDPEYRIIFLNKIFQVFSKKQDLKLLTKFVTKKNRQRDTAILYLMDILHREKHTFIIWKYFDLLKHAEVKDMPDLYSPEVFFIYCFANEQGIDLPEFGKFLYHLSVDPNQVLKSIVSEYESLKFFIILNFVGKFKRIQLPALLKLQNLSV